jgi:hypothetical protein
VLVLVLDFDRFWLGDVKQGEQLSEASVGIALAKQSRESITRTNASGPHR